MGRFGYQDMKNGYYRLYINIKKDVYCCLVGSQEIKSRYFTGETLGQFLGGDQTITERFQRHKINLECDRNKGRATIIIEIDSGVSLDKNEVHFFVLKLENQYERLVERIEYEKTCLQRLSLISKIIVDTVHKNPKKIAEHKIVEYAGKITKNRGAFLDMLKHNCRKKSIYDEMTVKTPPLSIEEQQ